MSHSNDTSENLASKQQDDAKKIARKHRRKISILSLSIIFIALLLIYLIYWLFWGRYHVYTEDAYVNGNIVSLMPQIPGTVIAIYADDTDLVVQGTPVIKLDKADFEITFQRAKANLALTVRQVREYYENAKRAEARLALRKADFQKAERDYKRRIGLVGERAISREELQTYQTRLQTTKAAFQAALHQFIAAYSLVENTHLYTHPIVEKAKAQFRKAYLNLDRTTVYAPVTGFVAKRNVNVGQQVNLRVPMLAIIPLTQIWVDANYKETQLSGLRIGQPVSVYADALPDVNFHGKIAGLNAGTGAAFAILPPQNATGNWIKIVQRLAVRVSLDPKEIQENPLQLGLSMHVTTDISDQSGKKLAKKGNTQPIFTTDIFATQLAASDRLIHNVLVENSPDLFLPQMNWTDKLS